MTFESCNKAPRLWKSVYVIERKKSLWLLFSRRKFRNVLFSPLKDSRSDSKIKVRLNAECSLVDRSQRFSRPTSLWFWTCMDVVRCYGVLSPRCVSHSEICLIVWRSKDFLVLSEFECCFGENVERYVCDNS